MVTYCSPSDAAGAPIFVHLAASTEDEAQSVPDNNSESEPLSQRRLSKTGNVAAISRL